MTNAETKLGGSELFLGVRPENGKFDRVHAILLTCDGRVLMRYKHGEPRVTGGKIDASDLDLESALCREMLEEVNCEIDRCDYLGYLRAEIIVENPGETKKTYENFARMVARVSKIGEPKFDPDRENNWIYGRSLVPFEVAKQELGMVQKFGQNNLAVLEAAYEVAKARGYFTQALSAEYDILNPESRG